MRKKPKKRVVARKASQRFAARSALVSDDSWKDSVEAAFFAWQKLPALRSTRWPRVLLDLQTSKTVYSTGRLFMHGRCALFEIVVRHAGDLPETLATLIHEMSHVVRYRLDDDYYHATPWRKTFLAAVEQATGVSVDDKGMSVRDLDTLVEGVFRCSTFKF